MAVNFTPQTDAIAEFLNFAPYGVDLEGCRGPAIIHYFQALKFDAAAYGKRIRTAHMPKVAKSLSMIRALPLRADWGNIKENVMLKALQCKFACHPVPHGLLLCTGTEEIAENAPIDSTLGCGPDGAGRNRLGILLMQVRRGLCGVAQ